MEARLPTRGVASMALAVLAASLRFTAVLAYPAMVELPGVGHLAASGANRAGGMASAGLVRGDPPLTAAPIPPQG
jgi:hypothetical protein